MQKIIVGGIGEVLIKRRRGQKSTTLRLAKNGDLVVSTNYSTPLYALAKFVDQQAGWIGEIREKSGLMHGVRIFNGQLLGAGIKFRLEPSNTLGLEAKYNKAKKEILIKGVNIYEDSLVLERSEKDIVEKEVIKALRSEARKILIDRLKVLAEMSGKSFMDVTIRNTSSRWGSCTSENKINLSLWLLILPTKLVDYVLIHELAHTVYKNHKAEFWNEVARWVPDYKERRKLLKKYSAQIWW